MVKCLMFNYQIVKSLILKAPYQMLNGNRSNLKQPQKTEIRPLNAIGHDSPLA